MDTALVWFRDDLRVTDNPTLSTAVDEADRVASVYAFDPSRRGKSRYGPEKTGAYRARFRRESVLDLRESIRELGGELLVRGGNPEQVVPELATRTGTETVYFQTKPATEAYETERSVRAALADRGIECESRWTHTLYYPEDLPTPVGEIDDTFTPWRHSVEENTTVREPVDAPERIVAPEHDVDPGAIPELSALGYDTPENDPRAVLRFEGGESAGMRRSEEYIWSGDHLRRYKRTRNGLLGGSYSSKLSPWLAMGCLSPRWVHREIRRYEVERVSNEDTYWLAFELMWRDFFQFQFEKHGSRFFRPGGIRGVETSWRHDDEAFRRWCRGETGVPFVDANMRELNRTGYMSNRGRQNVASFLVDVLGIDWRWGAAYFESRLVDYDVASNWGNWAYQAGVGNDTRDRFFDVLAQAERYDPDGEYVSTWLPELASVPSETVHRPWDLVDEGLGETAFELGENYPRPMVDVDARYDELRG